MVNYILTGLTIFLVLSIFTTTLPIENLTIQAQMGTLPESVFAGTNQAQLSELKLKTFQQSSNTNQASEFNVDFSNVINVPVYSQFAVFTADSSLSIIGANIKTTSGNVIDLVKDNLNTFSLTGISSGVYALDVTAQKEGETGTYGGILVIGEATNQEIQKQVVKITTDVDIVFKTPTLINDPCNYHGQNICDESGECDSERFDCWSDCSDGSTQTTGQCPGDDRPLRTIAADEGNSGESDLPDCDGSFQDCETESGFVCEAGSTDDNCETSDEENVEGESSNGEETSQEESEGDSGGEGDSGYSGGEGDSGYSGGEGDSGDSGYSGGEGDSGDSGGEGDSGDSDSSSEGEE